MRHATLLAAVLFGLATCTLALAQVPARIAWIGAGSPADEAPNLAAFRDGMREQGLQDGRHYLIEARYADGRYERFRALTDELIRRGPALILVRTIASVQAAQRATKAIPIVFVSTNDPVGSGLVASLARPGGNTTGLATQAEDIIVKQVELARETLPLATRVAVLVNPDNPSGPNLFKSVKAAAARFGIEARAFDASNPESLDATFAAISRYRPGALLTIGDSVFFDQRTQIARFAIKNSIPHFAASPEYAAAGSLMTYGTSPAAFFRRSAIYVKKILGGTKPADLPVEQPIIFTMVINQRTARTLGISIPPIVLLRANEVIE